jgi:hypothetical protein
VAGSSSPVSCSAGFYQDQTGNDTCKACTAGSYCTVNTTLPIACPSKHYCPSSTSTPIFCPNGTYTNAQGLTAPVECTPCPASVYCTQGAIQGNCTAGYFCRLGQSTPEPLADLSSFTAVQVLATLNYLLTLDGGQCPPGERFLDVVYKVLLHETI